MSSRTGPLSFATTTSDVAVVVDVAEGGAATHFRELEDGARSIGHVLEPPVAEIAEQLLSLLQRERIFRALRCLASPRR